VKNLAFFFILISLNSFSQTEAEYKAMFRKAFEEQKAMLEGKKPIDFKRSVWLVENAFHKNTLNYSLFCQDVTKIGKTLKVMIQKKGFDKFKTAGNWATFTYMTDTIPENNFKPYTYDFDDFYGKKNFTKQFITKLISSKNGNCHSLPFLYKLLCNEIGCPAYLALAPNHCYIKHPSEKGPWTNVEMTNASFPRDQWIMKTSATTIESIKQGVYMSALKPKEEIAFTLFDLANAYKHNYEYDAFYLEVVRTGLKYYPNSMELNSLLSNCLLDWIMKIKKQSKPDFVYGNKLIAEYKKVYAKIDALGYKEMSKEQYNDWMQSMEKIKKQRGLTKQK
jgi:hypothetical protein